MEPIVVVVVVVLHSQVLSFKLSLSLRIALNFCNSLLWVRMKMRTRMEIKIEFARSPQ